MALTAAVTVPAAKQGAKARTVALKGARVAPSAGRTTTFAFKLSASLRSRIRRAFASARTRTRVTALVTAKATDAAGNPTTKTFKVKLRR